MCRLLQRDERVIVVWSDSFDSIIPLCRDFEHKLIKLVWRNRRLVSSIPSATPSATASGSISTVKDPVLTESIPITEKERNNPNTRSNSLSRKSWWDWSWRLSPEKRAISADGDLEKEASSATKGPRPIRLYAPFYCGLATALSICMSDSGLPIPPSSDPSKFSLAVASASSWPNGSSIIITLVLSCSSHRRSSSVYHS